MRSVMLAVLLAVIGCAASAEEPAGLSKSAVAAMEQMKDRHAFGGRMIMPREAEEQQKKAAQAPNTPK